MKKSRILIVLAVLSVTLAATLAPASAHTQSIDHGGTYFGNVVVQPNQEVQGDVTVIGGNASVAGQIDGNITTIGGTIRELPGSVINGEKNQIGTDLASYVPWLPSPHTSSFALEENAKLMMRLAYSVVVVLIFLIFPLRVRIALDRVEQHPGLSAAVGVLALIAVIPVAIILFVTLLGWPLIPVEFLALAAGILIGQAALGLLIGRRLYELVHPQGTPSPLVALIIGLAIISAAEILPFVGGIVTALLWLVGLGAAILAFIGDLPSAPVVAAASSSPGRPTIGGPPMSRG